MPRVVPSDVIAIRPTTQEVLPFLLTASTLVDTYLAQAGLPIALLATIETWLTAHFMAVADPQVTKKDLGDTSVTYAHGTLGKGLESTSYGQQVLLLDTSGTLIGVGTRKRASIWVD